MFCSSLTFVYSSKGVQELVAFQIGDGKLAIGNLLDTHDVVTTIDVDNFSGDTRGEGTAQKQCRITNLTRLDIAPQGGALGSVL